MEEASAGRKVDVFFSGAKKIGDCKEHEAWKK